MGVHLDEVSLIQRRFREEGPAGGSDLLGQHLPPQQVQRTVVFVDVRGLMKSLSDCVERSLFAFKELLLDIIDRN